MSEIINDKEIDIVLEQRADFIDDKDILEITAESPNFLSSVNNLIKKQTTLLVGPRGCGKTHIMRYTYLMCNKDKSQPLAIYVSYHRYYRLEPMLYSRTNAMTLFHCWVLIQILLSLYDLTSNETDADGWLSTISPNKSELENLSSKIDKSLPLNNDELDLISRITINYVQIKIKDFIIANNRKRAILLMDDAALTLTPEYMQEFFDIFRGIKTSEISPKASVYPGTTEYGARFHPNQEAIFEDVWLPVNDPNYLESMNLIASKRISQYLDISEDVKNYLAYAAFGIPRAYLSLLNEFSRKKFSTNQQGLNRIVQLSHEARIEEYNTLKIKSPKLKSIINIGNDFFNKIIEELKVFNDKSYLKGEKQYLIGIQNIDEFDYAERMLNLLVEAGLLYELKEKVSHGNAREYKRYIPHFSSLFSNRVFSANEKGWSARFILDRLEQKSTRQPLRRSLSKVLDREKLLSLKLDVPACLSCSTERIKPNQKFCHNCGAELIDYSTYQECMGLPLYEVPGLTNWQAKKIKNELSSFKSIGALLALQDPGNEVRKIRHVGPIRAEKIITLVLSFIDEFLQ
jgi:hypothetical protein